jgi:uncharacterized membrane protein YccF (DUF307 family)
VSGNVRFWLIFIGLWLALSGVIIGVCLALAAVFS